MPTTSASPLKVLVTGATGLLGCSLVPILRKQGWDVLTCARGGDVTAAADLCQAAEAEDLVSTLRPATVVHLAAASDVDLCEREPQLAYRQNVLATANLARACLHAGAINLIHFSTDHLYDGPGLQTEDQVTVRNYYAMSKLAGEYASLCHGRTTVLRVNFVGQSQRPGRSSFTDWAVDALRAGKPIQVFDDVWFSPLRMASLARATAEVIARPATGVYNLGARGSITKAQMAFGLAQGLKLDSAGMQAVSIVQRPGLAPRPRGMGMDSSRFERVFAVRLPSVQEEVQALLQEYSQ